MASRTQWTSQDISYSMASQSNGQARTRQSNDSWSLRTQDSWMWVWKLTCSYQWEIYACHGLVLFWLGICSNTLITIHSSSLQGYFYLFNRITLFLYYHPYHPILYPRMPLHGFHAIHNNYDTPHFSEHITTNAFAVFDDADHGGDQYTDIY